MRTAGPLAEQGTVLAVPQVRVSARWICCARVTSIEMLVTGVAGTVDHRRHSDVRTDWQRPFLAVRPHEISGQVMGIPPPPCLGELPSGLWDLEPWPLGVLLLASGRWLGPLAWLGAVPLAGSALIFWTAYRLQTSVQS